MTKSSTRFLVMVVLLPVSLACDGDRDADSDPIDARDAEVGWSAANHAVGAGHTHFATDVVLGHDGDVELACEGGGRIRLVGRIDGDDDFGLDAEFDGCVDDGVVIDGELTLVASVDVDLEPGAIGAAVLVDYTGELVFDGAVEGSCSIDAQVRAHAVVFDGFASAGVSVEGTLCEHDAAIVVHGDVDHDD